MVNEDSLQNKWWWRTLKVVYIFTWLIALLIIPSIIPLTMSIFGYEHISSPFWTTLIVDIIVSFVIIETIKSILLYILGYTVWRGVLLWAWLLKWAIVGGAIGLILEPLLGFTRFWIVWAIFIIIAFGYKPLKDHIKKKRNK